ncbi:MAG: endonuclease [Pseudomonadota bacterium]
MEKVNTHFQRMQADMHNIYPAIGAVNALRSNYDFTLLPDKENDFGMCPMKVNGHKAEPPPNTRGKIARAYLYMESTYPQYYRMNDEQREVMQLWNKLYPVTEDECRRAWRISMIQGNENLFIKNQCTEIKLQ